MKLIFNKKDLVKFGKYLLSDKRTEKILDHPISCKDPEGVEKRLKDVSDSDVENFIESIKKIE